VVQRGNNRSPCFYRESDHLLYLRLLGEFASRCGCSIHAYCLMTNHVHLFLTPHDAESCAQLMKNVSQLYSQYINRTQGRTGTLWEGRFRSCLVADERYTLACYRYIELNPVRAGIATGPAEYPWSSYGANAGLRRDSLVTPHLAYLALSDEPTRRAERYAELAANGIDGRIIDDIRHATRNSSLLGRQQAKRGRPRKMEKIGSVPIFGGAA
jgi:putative transposase